MKGNVMDNIVLNNFNEEPLIFVDMIIGMLFFTSNISQVSLKNYFSSSPACFRFAITYYLYLCKVQIRLAIAEYPGNTGPCNWSTTY